MSGGSRGFSCCLLSALSLSHVAEPGFISYPLAGRPLDQGKCCLSSFPLTISTAQGLGLGAEFWLWAQGLMLMCTRGRCDSGAVIRGGCAECPGKAKGYKWSLMSRSHGPRGEFNRRSRGGERSAFLSLSS